MSVSAPPTGIIQDLGDRHEVRLPIFEGPLDLMLHLIRKEHIDIYDIPIAQITGQYLDYIRLMEELNINVAGEFLEMAATLIYIKSKMLLPPPPVENGDLPMDDDPRRELVEQLLEYEKYKNAAQELYHREQIEAGMWSASRQQEVLPPEEELVAATLFDLLSAYQAIIRRLEERRSLEMEREAVTVAEKIQQIKEALRVRKRFRFSYLLRGRVSRVQLVVLFVAVLELVRLRCVRVRQEELFADFWILRGPELTWS